MAIMLLSYGLFLFNQSLHVTQIKKWKQKKNVGEPN